MSSQVRVGGVGLLAFVGRFPGARHVRLRNTHLLSLDVGDSAAVGRDVSFGYYTAEEAAKRFGVAVDSKNFAVDAKATQELRRRTA